MAGFFRTDSGKSFKPGRINSSRTNSRLQQRPEAGRAPNFRQGVSGGANQQSIKPPTKGNTGGNGFGIKPLREAAIFFSTWMSENLAKSAGTKGAANMSILGGDAPVYQTPLNNVKPEEVSRPSQSERLRGKPPAPPQAAVEPKGKTQVAEYTVNGVTYDSNSGRPKGAPEGGYSLEPDGKMTPHSSSGSGGSTERTNPNGITQKGLTLGGINGLFASLNSSGKITEGELPSAGKFFSEALPTTKQGATQLGHGSLVTGPDGKPMEQEDHVWNDQTGRLEPPTAPGTTGGKPDDAEDGTSNKPDVADQIRQVRMHRNKRDQLEGFSVDEPLGGKDETKGNGMTKERMTARSAFLDPNNKGYAAIRARDRAVGAFDQNGTGGMRIDDEFVQFNPGMSADARYELAGGKVQSKDDAQAFLEKYTQKLTKPEEEEK